MPCSFADDWQRLQGRRRVHFGPMYSAARQDVEVRSALLNCFNSFSVTDFSPRALKG